MPDPPVKDRCGRPADHFVRLQAGTARRTPTRETFEETLDGVKAVRAKVASKGRLEGTTSNHFRCDRHNFFLVFQ